MFKVIPGSFKSTKGTEANIAPTCQEVKGLNLKKKKKNYMDDPLVPYIFNWYMPFCLRIVELNKMIFFSIIFF